MAGPLPGQYILRCPLPDRDPPVFVQVVTQLIGWSTVSSVLSYEINTILRIGLSPMLDLWGGGRTIYQSTLAVVWSIVQQQIGQKNVNKTGVYATLER